MKLLERTDTYTVDGWEVPTSFSDPFITLLGYDTDNRRVAITAEWSYAAAIAEGIQAEGEVTVEAESYLVTVLP
jgi:hypothetical protein